MYLKIKLDPYAKMPTKAHPTDAGLDLYCITGGTVWPHEPLTVDTGVHIEIPAGYFGSVRSKSGLMVNHNLTATGVVDSGYTGAIKVHLINHGNQPYEVKVGDKVAQLIIEPVAAVSLVRVEELGETDRGDNGFGSSGR